MTIVYHIDLGVVRSSKLSSL